jgi:hypothetical protein
MHTVFIDSEFKTYKLRDAINKETVSCRVDFLYSPRLDHKNLEGIMINN